MYYIDGNNLEGVIPELEVGTPQAEAAVIHWVQLWAKTSGKKVTLAFDGHRTAERQASGVRLVYPGAQDSNADDVLRRLISKDTQRTNSTLVSNDGELVRFARSHGVQHMYAREFVRLLEETEHHVRKEQSERKPAAPTEAEVSEWMKYFGFRPDGNRRK